MIPPDRERDAIHQDAEFGDPPTPAMPVAPLPLELRRTTRRGRSRRMSSIVGAAKIVMESSRTSTALDPPVVSAGLATDTVIPGRL